MLRSLIGFILIGSRCLFVGMMPMAQVVVPLDRMEKMSFIENEYIKVGIDLNLGGGYYLPGRSSKRRKTSLIIRIREGRSRCRFTADLVPYEPNGKKSHPAWTFIGWNPIQSGRRSGA